MSVGDESIEEFKADTEAIKGALARVIVGQEAVVEEVLVCLFAGGHVLLEGAPGLGKTLLVRSLGEALDLEFSRIQFTPDLMPGDIVGTRMVVDDEIGRKRFQLERGPIFAQIVLADEINRATPKTQSALLEAMAEQGVTIAGEQHRLRDPFFVLATENPIEMEGTYPLPEAQLDRFLFKVLVPSPDEDTLVEILSRTTGNAQRSVPTVIGAERLLAMRELVRSVHVSEPLMRYIARLVRSSDPADSQSSKTARSFLRYGAGVRGAQAIQLSAKVRALMSGRGHANADDVRASFLPALRHRIIANFEAEADGIGADQILVRLLEECPEQSPVVESIAG